MAERRAVRELLQAAQDALAAVDTGSKSEWRAGSRPEWRAGSMSDPHARFLDAALELEAGFQEQS